MAGRVASVTGICEVGVPPWVTVCPSIRRARDLLGEATSAAPLPEQTASSTATAAATSSGTVPRKHWRSRLTKRARQYNYASYDCNAKVIDANPGSQRVRSILSDDLDKYALNQCKANIFYVVQLCDDIRIVALQLSNYEYFSSTFRNFTVWVSEQYPAQQWHLLASFEAKNRRREQTFHITRDDDWYRVHYFKYVKIEMHTHWDTEAYCPLTQFKVQGMTMYEDWMAENNVQPDDDGEADTADGDEHAAMRWAPTVLHCVTYAWRVVWALPHIAECCIAKALTRADMAQCFPEFPQPHNHTAPEAAANATAFKSTELVPAVRHQTLRRPPWTALSVSPPLYRRGRGSTLAQSDATLPPAPALIPTTAAPTPTRTVVTTTTVTATALPPAFTASPLLVAPTALVVAPSTTTCPPEYVLWKDYACTPYRPPLHRSLLAPGCRYRDWLSMCPPHGTRLAATALLIGRGTEGWAEAEVPEPPRLADKEEQGPGGIYWKFDAKIKQLEEYADANSKYLSELHRRYVAPHASMHAELMHEIRAQQAHHHASLLPQIDALRTSLRTLQRDMHLTKTKVDVVGGWVTWVFVCLAYLALVYVVLAVAKAAWIGVRRVWTTAPAASTAVEEVPRVFRRSMSSVATENARRLPLHKSTIHSLDLPGPRLRAVPGVAIASIDGLGTTLVRFPTDEGIATDADNNVTYPITSKAAKKRKKSKIKQKHRPLEAVTTR